MGNSQSRQTAKPPSQATTTEDNTSQSCLLGNQKTGHTAHFSIAKQDLGDMNIKPQTVTEGKQTFFPTP